MIFLKTWPPDRMLWAKVPLLMLKILVSLEVFLLLKNPQKTFLAMRIDLLLRWTPTAVFSIMLWYSRDFCSPSGCNKGSLIMYQHQLRFVAAISFPALLLFFYLVKNYLWDSNPIDWLENLCSMHFQVFFIWKCKTSLVVFVQEIDSKHWDCP